MAHTTAHCDVCGCALPPRPAGKRGAPQRYCDADTGRPCLELAKALRRVRALQESVLEGTPSSHRTKAQRHIRMELRSIAQDTTETAARLDGDTTRRFSVGSDADKSVAQFGA